MNPIETILPRALALVQLFVSLVMFGIIIYLAVNLMRGHTVPLRFWAFPMTILTIDWILIRILRGQQLSFPLYMSTIALWLLTTGYYVVHLRTLLPV